MWWLANKEAGRLIPQLAAKDCRANKKRKEKGEKKRKKKEKRKEKTTDSTGQELCWRKQTSGFYEIFFPYRICKLHCNLWPLSVGVNARHRRAEDTQKALFSCSGKWYSTFTVADSCGRLKLTSQIFLSNVRSPGAACQEAGRWQRLGRVRKTYLHRACDAWQKYLKPDQRQQV